MQQENGVDSRTWWDGVASVVIANTEDMTDYSICNPSLGIVTVLPLLLLVLLHLLLLVYYYSYYCLYC